MLVHSLVLEAFLLGKSIPPNLLDTDWLLGNLGIASLCLRLGELFCVRFSVMDDEDSLRENASNAAPVCREF